MSQEHDWQYDLDEYIRQGEPDRLEKKCCMADSERLTRC